MTETTESELRSYLESLAADTDARKPKNWQRPAHPTVYADYVEFIESGHYPYIDAVVTKIIKKHKLVDDLTLPFHHQAVHDRGDAIAIALHTEVYIASGQHRAEKMKLKADALTEQGFTPITQLTPKEGMKIILNDGITYRLAEVTDQGDWALLPPRKRTRGVSLNKLVRQHENFELAIAEQQTRHNDPAVRMFKPA